MASKGLQSILKDYDQFLSFGSDDISPHVFPTGLLALNYVLSDYQGFTGGSIVQLLGENKHGKSTVALDIIAQAQQTNLNEIIVKGRKINVVILDFERSFDPVYAQTMGIQTDKVLVVRTHYAEESFSIAEHLLLDGVQVVLVDSIGMLVSKDEEDKDYDDNEKVAAEAKTLGRFIKRCNAFMRNDTLIIVINQYRANLSSMARSEKKPYGARIMQYATKVTIELRRIKNEDTRATVEVLVSKNKIGGKEGQKATFDIVYGEGIDYPQHTLDLALEFGIVERKGAWYVYNDYKAQGAENAKETFPMDKIKEKVIAYMEKGTDDK